MSRQMKFASIRHSLDTNYVIGINELNSDQIGKHSIDLNSKLSFENSWNQL